MSEEIKGKQCLPALVHHNHKEFECLSKYEVLPIEGLHTIAGHIKNIYQEIQYHLDKVEKEKFTKSMNASFAGKDAKRECDYRLSLVDLSKLIVGQNILKEYHLRVPTPPQISSNLLNFGFAPQISLNLLIFLQFVQFSPQISSNGFILVDKIFF